MIAYLKGRVQHREDASLVLRVGDIGYHINVSPGVISSVDTGQDIELHIHEHLAEGVHDLYGFAAREELELFGLMLQVSGVGPKSALGILSQGNVEELKQAIIHGNTSVLTKSAGIGKKTAQRIIVDLKNKLDIHGEGTDELPKEEDLEAIEGLVGLGYSKKEARAALASIDLSVNTTEERVRHALKHLGRR